MNPWVFVFFSPSKWCFSDVCVGPGTETKTQPLSSMIIKVNRVEGARLWRQLQALEGRKRGEERPEPSNPQDSLSERWAHYSEASREQQSTTIISFEDPGRLHEAPKGRKQTNGEGRSGLNKNCLFPLSIEPGFATVCLNEQGPDPALG